MNNYGYDFSILKQKPNEWADFGLISDMEPTRIILEKSVIYCDTFDSLKNILNSFNNEWIHRGLSKHKYLLKTSLDRFIKNSDSKNSISFFKKIYFKILNNYCENIPKVSNLENIYINNTIEYFALMQHFGAPTPLMDWTYSPFIALFFSIYENENICNDNNYHSIWSLNQNIIKEKSFEIIKEKLPNFDNESKIFDSKDYKNILEYFSMNDNCHGFILPILIDRKNTREEAQKGLFTLNGSILVDFSYNIASMFNKSNDLINVSNILKKIIFPQNLQLDILNFLYNKNITANTLFPGLDGYFKSFKQSFYNKYHFYEKNNKEKTELINNNKFSKNF